MAPCVGLETRLGTLTPLEALLPLEKLATEGYVPQVSLEAQCPQEDLCWPLLFSYIMLLITSTVFTTSLVSLIFLGGAIFIWSQNTMFQEGKGCGCLIKRLLASIIPDKCRHMVNTV